METLSNPDAACFVSARLPIFQPHYVEVGGLRMHYVDEGPQSAEHGADAPDGEPSW